MHYEKKKLNKKFQRQKRFFFQNSFYLTGVDVHLQMETPKFRHLYAVYCLIWCEKPGVGALSADGLSELLVHLLVLKEEKQEHFHNTKFPFSQVLVKMGTRRALDFEKLTFLDTDGGTFLKASSKFCRLTLTSAMLPPPQNLDAGDDKQQRLVSGPAPGLLLARVQSCDPPPAPQRPHQPEGGPTSKSSI